MPLFFTTEDDPISGELSHVVYRSSSGTFAKVFTTDLAISDLAADGMGNFYVVVTDFFSSSLLRNGRELLYSDGLLGDLAEARVAARGDGTLYFTTVSNGFTQAHVIRRSLTGELHPVFTTEQVISDLAVDDLGNFYVGTTNFMDSSLLLNGTQPLYLGDAFGPLGEPSVAASGGGVVFFTTLFDRFAPSGVVRRDIDGSLALVHSTVLAIADIAADDVGTFYGVETTFLSSWLFANGIQTLYSDGQFGNLAEGSVAVSPGCQRTGSPLMEQYPESKSLGDLDPEFGSNVSRFLDALAHATAPNGAPNPAVVEIKETFRSPARAYLMHFAYRVANEAFEPGSVPSPSDVIPRIRDLGEVCWLHTNAFGNPDKTASKVAAMEMLGTCCPSGFGEAPAYPSNHQKGTAIDMHITWRGDLVVTDGSGVRRTIRSLPRNGAGNSELWSVGESYGVLKRKKDRPHWSTTGR